MENDEEMEALPIRGLMFGLMFSMLFWVPVGLLVCVAVR